MGKNLDVNHIGFLKPMLGRMEQDGNLNALYKNIRWANKFNLNKNDVYIPNVLVDELYQKSKKIVGIEDITREYYSNFKIEELLLYGDLLAQSPDLLSFIHDGIKYGYTFQSDCHLSLVNNGPSSILYSSINENKKFDIHSDYYDVTNAMTLRIFKEIFGDDWLPLSIDLPNDSIPEYIFLIFDFMEIKINLKKPCFGVEFETSRMDFSLSPGNEESFNMDVFDTFSKHVHAVLKSSNSGYFFSLSDLSNFFGVSTKTIHRKLSEEGSSFLVISQRVLFNKAIKLLESSEMNVLEISQDLGYSNESNFLKAFKRWTGSTPSKYRSLYQRNS